MLDDNQIQTISLNSENESPKAGIDMRKANNTDFGEVYSAYAAGCLDPAFALMVETQAAIKPEVSRAISRAEMVAGIIFEAETPSEMSDSALDDMLAVIDAHEARPQMQVKGARKASGAIDELLALPDPLRDHAIDAAGRAGWQTLKTGVRRLKLDLGSQAEVELYRIEPGATVPKHRHVGDEFTLVVSGGFYDVDGSYGPGDLCIKGEHDMHQPTGDMDGVCFALAVHEGGLRFTGLAGVVQRLLGQ